MPVPFVWVPSPARTIPLWDTATSAPGGRLATALPLRWRDKPAAAALDYSIDGTGLLAGGDGGLTLTVNGAGGLTVAAIVVSGVIASLFVTGGQAGAYAVVDLTLATDSGRRVRRVVRMGIV